MSSKESRWREMSKSDGNGTRILGFLVVNLTKPYVFEDPCQDRIEHCIFVPERSVREGYGKSRIGFMAES